jgi:glutamate/tyrosine decarboxylase-like PLP-dependent enzyme
LAGTENRIQHLARADSIGIDFHKTGFAPYISSLVLLRDRSDFQYLSRERAAMPYLYHSGQYHPGMYTLETTRAAGGVMAALANLLLFGKEGLRALLGHAVEMAELLRELILARPELTVLNDQNLGPVTLFRAYPDGVDTFSVKEHEQRDESFRPRLLAYNEYNRKIYELAHREALLGQGVAIGFTDEYRRTDYGEPIVALKSYVLSPYVDEERMQSVIDHVLAARAKVES